MSLDTARIESRPERLTAHEARQRLEHERNSRLTQLQALDEAGQSAEKHMMSAQKDTIVRVLNEIEAALTRIHDGRYGICQTCSTPIPVERLEILPYTRFCVPCQRTTA
ncbi:TraR/DksA family transcriptional regulator [Streptomyces sp. AM8-1-1]|uniref:TraR/DksA family transcriptional regulator n=1 Tax=Streptomyces sp. AM8-1-1 TaxID=3075825 RepID=UPI0028C487B4|nr:TraR/DksA C4-type zinc finger protein [Streptomyces sp. AM8-1-1]WNO70235.1 TraR/DksA C4-type zinc finger protein [Streptomyces sp. AM8-1-1]